MKPQKIKEKSPPLGVDVLVRYDPKSSAILAGQWIVGRFLKPNEGCYILDDNHQFPVPLDWLDYWCELPDVSDEQFIKDSIKEIVNSFPWKVESPTVVLLVDRPDVGQEWHLFTGEDTIERAKAVSEGFIKRGDHCIILKATEEIKTRAAESMETWRLNEDDAQVVEKALADGSAQPNLDAIELPEYKDEKGV